MVLKAITGKFHFVDSGGPCGQKDDDGEAKLT